ncbi:impact family protein [Trichodelitschia bisporula]|uniref:Impact family protein n=1 Tax=Trichodelitschia bisporula TaxID=703511 RepID=A0A6G1I503_9PEZI|nr:impact family protein [Trichodelitschia bisporula]
MAVPNALSDEITSINAIYDSETLVLVSEDPLICTLQLPQLSITLRLQFPSDYPDGPPVVLGTQTVGENVPQGLGHEVVDIARRVLGEMYAPGEECVFMLIEEIAQRAVQYQPNDNEHISHEEAPDPPPQDLGPPPPWNVAEAIIEKRSVFVGRAVAVESVDQAKQYLQHLLATDKKVAKATHNMTAWRIRGPNGTTFQDCDDDGENAAGGRMLHLMQSMDVWDVMVVVTRWYGGVLLGPDRFRIINNAARDALVAGGFAKEKETKRKGKR